MSGINDNKPADVNRENVMTENQSFQGNSFKAN